MEHRLGSRELLRQLVTLVHQPEVFRSEQAVDAEAEALAKQIRHQPETQIDEIGLDLAQKALDSWAFEKIDTLMTVTKLQKVSAGVGERCCKFSSRGGMVVGLSPGNKLKAVARYPMKARDLGKILDIALITDVDETIQPAEEVSVFGVQVVRKEMPDARLELREPEERVVSKLALPRLKMARELKYSESTVGSKLTQAEQRLGITRPQLIELAMANKLIELNELPQVQWSLFGGHELGFVAHDLYDDKIGHEASAGSAKATRKYRKELIQRSGLINRDQLYIAAIRDGLVEIIPQAAEPEYLSAAA